MSAHDEVRNQEYRPELERLIPKSQPQQNRSLTQESLAGPFPIQPESQPQQEDYFPCPHEFEPSEFGINLCIKCGVSQPQQDRCATCGVIRRDHQQLAKHVFTEPQQDAPSEAELDSELKSYGIDPKSLEQMPELVARVIRAEAALTQAQSKIEDMGEQIAGLLNTNYKLEHDTVPDLERRLTQAQEELKAWRIGFAALSALAVTKIK